MGSRYSGAASTATTASVDSASAATSRAVYCSCRPSWPTSCVGSVMNTATLASGLASSRATTEAVVTM